MNKRKYRRPNGEYTIDPDLYADEWINLGKQLEKYFPGYKAMGFNPGVRMRRTEGNIEIDSFNLSIMAINCLLTRTEPEQVLRDDLQIKTILSKNDEILKRTFEL